MLRLNRKLMLIVFFEILLTDTGYGFTLFVPWQELQGGELQRTRGSRSTHLNLFVQRAWIRTILEW